MTSAIRTQRILCPVDGSAPSAHACLQAIAFARWSGAAVTTLYVNEPMYMASPEFAPLLLEPANGRAQEMRGWTQDAFGQAIADGVPVDIVMKAGVPAKEILACATQLPADLIVIGTHGTGGFERFVLGSTTEKVLRAATCPVLTVPPRDTAASRLPFQRVLCGLDFSDCSLAGVEFAMSAAMMSGASLTLAHVLEWPWHEPPPPDFDELPPAQAAALRAYRQRREADAFARLAALIPDALRNRCHARVLHGRAYVELLKLAAEEQADLIVLGVHGRNPVDMALFGSTTNHVVRRAACPVLTLRR